MTELELFLAMVLNVLSLVGVWHLTRQLVTWIRGRFARHGASREGSGQ